MPDIACPSCGAVGPGGAFCETCGAALPARRKPRAGVLPYRPRAADAELAKQTAKAANTLLAVCIIQSIVGLVLGVIAYNNTGSDWEQMGKLLLIQCGVAALFYGLYFWARISPLPATIVGLVLYSTLIAINVVAAVQQLSNGGGTGIGGIGVGYLDIVFMVFLIGGIQAAVKQKRLVESRGY